MIGGTLAKPAARYPNLFNYQLLRKYPYLLSCLVTSAFALFASSLAAFFLQEVRLSRKYCVYTNSAADPEQTNRRPTTHPPKSGSEAQQSPPAQLETQSIRALLSIPTLRTVCLSSGAIGFIASSFSTVFVLDAYTSIPAGGLSLSVRLPPHLWNCSGLARRLIQTHSPSASRSRSRSWAHSPSRSSLCSLSSSGAIPRAPSFSHPCASGP